MPAVMEFSTAGPASTPAEHRERLGGNHFVKGRKGKLDLLTLHLAQGSQAHMGLIESTALVVSDIAQK